jgi:hypothetical protein
MILTADDDRFFRSNPSRNFRCRLATSDELNACRDMQWFDGNVLAEGCFVHALVRRNLASNGIRAYLIALEPGERGEADVAALWFHAEMDNSCCNEVRQ